MDDRLLAFIAVSIAVVVIPGPDMALVARNVLRYGRSAGFATSLGICQAALSRPEPRRLVRWVTGTVLVALGARVALERT